MTISAYCASFISTSSSANKLVVDIKSLIESSKSIPSNFDNFTPSSNTPCITFVVVIPALANASNPSVIDAVAIPNLLEYSIAALPIAWALSDSPPIACTLAICCWKLIASLVPEAYKALTATPAPIAIVSVCVKNSEVLKAIWPNMLPTVLDKPINSLDTSATPLASILKV